MNTLSALFKNWKSTLAFIIFIAVYVYAIYTDKSSVIIDITGSIALYSSIFMMFRSDFTSTMLETLINKIPLGRNKD